MYEQLLQQCQLLINDLEDKSKTSYNIKLYTSTLRKIGDLFYPDINVKHTKKYPPSHDFYAGITELREIAISHNSSRFHTLIISFYAPMVNIIKDYAMLQGESPPKYILDYKMKKRQIFYAPFIDFIEEMEVKQYITLPLSQELYLENSYDESNIVDYICKKYYDQYGILNIQAINKEEI